MSEPEMADCPVQCHGFGICPRCGNTGRVPKASLGPFDEGYEFEPLPGGAGTDDQEGDDDG